MGNLKYTYELLAPIAANSLSITEVIRKLGRRWSGGLHGHVKRRLNDFGIDTSHFLGQKINSGTRHIGGPARRASVDVLVFRTTGKRQRSRMLRRAMLEEGKILKCTRCGLQDTWNNQPITLEINHINGNNIDDRLTNLEFICPNCHSQIPNHAGVLQRKRE